MIGIGFALLWNYKFWHVRHYNGTLAHDGTRVAGLQVGPFEIGVKWLPGPAQNRTLKQIR